ncbi:Hypothetical_protein [Hexamita inflata]|uniref:Hypothetical_protein n=1 Tax=Hexamita inflata TaxID=28002 RepID=A0ABP1I8I4_9EUKA
MMNQQLKVNEVRYMNVNTLEFLPYLTDTVKQSLTYHSHCTIIVVSNIKNISKNTEDICIFYFYFKLIIISLLASQQLLDRKTMKNFETFFAFFFTSIMLGQTHRFNTQMRA